MLLLVSCEYKNSKITDERPPLYDEPAEVSVNLKDGYQINPFTGDSIRALVNEQGDTIPTGVHIPVVGRMVDPDDLEEPVMISPKKLEPLELIDNVSPVTPQPEITLIDTSQLTRVELGDGDSSCILSNKYGDIPSGVPLNIKGKLVPFFQPEPVEALPPTYKENTRFDFQNLNKEQGLPYPYVGTTFQDSRGNLWFCTEGNGVSKFDGTHFYNYNKRQGFMADIVWTVMEDHLGNLWFGTQDGGACKYDGHNFVQFSEKEGMPTNQSWKMIEDKNYNIWIITGGKGVSKLELSADGISGTITHYTCREGLYDNNVPGFLQDRNGDFWFGTRGAVNKFDGSHFTYLTAAEGLKGIIKRDILEDNKGNLWICTMDGLHRFDGNSMARFTTSDGLHSNIVWRSLEDRSGNLWIGLGNINNSTGGLVKFDGNHFSYFGVKEGFTNSSIPHVYQDRSGNLWMGSYGKGVFRYKENSFKTYFENQNFPNPTVYGSISNLVDSNILLINHDTLSIFDGKKFWRISLENLPGLNKTKLIYSAYQDPKQNFWMGTFIHGACKYDGQNLIQLTEKQGLLSDGIGMIKGDRAGNIWFMHWAQEGKIPSNNDNIPYKTNGGLTIFNPNGNNGKGKFIQFDKERKFLFLNPTSFLEDSHGDIWFGSHEAGICRYEPPKNSKDSLGYFTYYSTKQGLPSNEIYGIEEDNEKNIWITFGNSFKGIIKYVPPRDGNIGRFLSYTQKQGLSDEYAWGITKDQNNGLWFTTDNGFTQLKSVGKNIKNESIYRINNLGYYDGITGREPHSTIIDRKNRLWSITSNGYVSLDLDRYESDTLPPTMQLNQIRIKEQFYDFNHLPDTVDKKIRFDSVAAFYNYPIGLRLPYYLDQIEFNYSAIDWKAPQKILYSYRLVGKNNEWSKPTRQTSVEYRFLGYGNYTFEILAMGESGVWSKPFRYHFVIFAPWWLRWWAYLLYAVIAFFVFRGILQWRQRKLIKDKRKLEEQVTTRTRELHESLENLKSTQTQLVHSEKMASLGELTAGIAHEIQNPLNFVNNFSDVNKELIDETTEAINASNLEEAKELLKNLKDNEEKIKQHGGRADAIVKSMLQHSRSRSGEKVPTDINNLCDEYLRLAYHGFRAKDKDFNAEIVTDYDGNVGQLYIVPQDIGRVLLNLYNNAFYTVSQKAQSLGSEFVPRVRVRTSKSNRKVNISIHDNGNGMPESVKQKIFQPFFTTKPTGQGTGLGLSISYDIIKAHGGTITVHSKEKEFTEFVLELPA